jgi:hypothetical protein
MYTLLAICLVLHPQRIDESLHSMLKEKNYAEKMNKVPILLLSISTEKNLDKKFVLC